MLGLSLQATAPSQPHSRDSKQMILFSISYSIQQTTPYYKTSSDDFVQMSVNVSGPDIFL